MNSYPADRLSRWLFYLSWNNVLENRKKEISLDLNTLSQSIEHTILVSNNVINDLASYIRTHTEMTNGGFRSYTSELLVHYPFIEGITLSLPGNENDSGNIFSIHENVFRKKEIFKKGTNMFSEQGLAQTLEELINPGMPPVMSTVIKVEDQLFYVIHSLVLVDPGTTDKSQENLIGIISLFSDPEKYFENISLPNNVALTLYSE